MNRNRYILMLVLAVALSLGGCGYHFSGGASPSSPVKGRSVAVPIFSNTTYRPYLETIFTAGMRDEISRRTGATPSEMEKSDLVLQGTVSKYSSSAVSYSSDDRIREFRATLTVEAILRERATGNVLWKGSVTRSQDYPQMEFPLNNPPVAERLEPQNRSALQQNAEDAAMREVARKISRELYEQMNEGF